MLWALDILLIVKDKLNLKVQSIFIDLLAVIVITFIISYIATLLYQSIYNKITNKWYISTNFYLLNQKKKEDVCFSDGILFFSILIDYNSPKMEN